MSVRVRTGDPLSGRQREVLAAVAVLPVCAALLLDEFVSIWWAREKRGRETNEATKPRDPAALQLSTQRHGQPGKPSQSDQETP